MTAEFTIEQIRAFVSKGYTSVAARYAKSALQHFDAIAERMPTEEEVSSFLGYCERDLEYRFGFLKGTNWFRSRMEKKK
jgi:hypothetical protein